jgi:multiple sugar transport system substrate-binding protein
MTREVRPMLSRRRLLAGGGLLGAGMLMPGLAACGGSGSAGSGAAAQKVKVPGALVDAAKELPNKSASMLSMQMYTTQADAAVSNAIKEFGRQTGTKVSNASYNADAGNFVAKQDAAVRSGQVQDLAFVSASRFIAQLHQLDLVQDVSDVVAEMTTSYGAPAPVAEHYMKIGGKWWGVPFYTIGSGTFLRKDWLDDKGIKVGDVKTYENARDIALEISDPSKNRYGWGFTVNRGGDGNGFINGVVNAYGGSVTSDDGRKVVFDSPETIDAVTYLATIFTSPKYRAMLPPGIMSWTDTGNNEAWLAGLVGMTLNQDSLYAQSKSTKNPVYGNTAVIRGLLGPAARASLTFGDLSCFIIWKGAKNPALAKLIPRYLAAGATMRTLAEASGAGVALPAYDKIWTGDSYFLHGDPIFKVSYEMMTAPIPVKVSTGYAFPQAPSAGFNAVYQAYILTDMMGEIIQKGTSVKTAVATAHSRMVQTFEQQGIKQ